MSFKGQPISKDEFDKMRYRFLKKNPDQTKHVIFDRETFERILKNKDIAHISVVFGADDDDRTTVMFVGIDSKGETMYATAENRGQPCPPYC